MTDRSKQMPFTTDGENWLRELAHAGKSDHTLDCYARDLRNVAEATGHHDTRNLTSLDQAAVDSIAATWREAGVCDATVVRRFSALRGFAAYLVRERGINLSKLLSADFPAAPKRKRQAVGDAEIGLLLSDDPAGWRDARDSALFAVESDAGLTPAETVRLDVGHVDLGSRLIRVVDTHLTPRIAGISDRSRDLVAEYLRALPFPLAKTDPLFVTSKRNRLNVRSAQVSFRRRRMRLGISPQATLMGLRHATAARLVSEGSEPDVVASALGVLGATAGRYFES